MDDRYRLDKERIRRSFDRAAARYDEVAVLQREVGERMLDRMELIRLCPRRILDIGAGTGYCSRLLRRRYPRAELISADLAPAMVVRAAERATVWERLLGRHHFVVADMEQLPVADGSVDLLFSNLTLQWCPAPERAFGELRRVLRPGGLLMFTTFGPDTLRELRLCWGEVDGYTHVSAFAEMQRVGDLLLESRFADPVVDSETFTLTYAKVRDLMRDLKMLGAHNATAGRQRGLTGKGRFAALVDAYEGWRRDGVLPATYEVIYGHAWAPEPGVAQRAGKQRDAIPLAQLRTALGRRRP